MEREPLNESDPNTTLAVYDKILAKENKRLTGLQEREIYIKPSAQAA